MMDQENGTFSMNQIVKATRMTDFSKGVAYVDEQFVPMAEAKISILDWGFLHSDATYDVTHVWKGSFFRLDDHIDRFLSGTAGRVLETTPRPPLHV